LTTIVNLDNACRVPAARVPSRRRRRIGTWLGLLALGGLLAGCGSAGTDGGTGAAADAAGVVDVVAGFYPLEYVAQEVGGELVTVTRLAAPGVEPHDLELTPGGVAAVSEAGLVVYLPGFQPAVDEAVAAQAPDRALDVSQAARLTVPAPDGATDPHFWLDPTRLADVARAVADRLAGDDPEHAGTYRANADRLASELADLDAELAAGLATCRSRLLVVSHAAFGYLADRYDLSQHGIRGLSPDDEPSARALAELADLVRDQAVRTVYFEPLVSSDVAETVAAEAGVRTDVLDPVEGLSEASQARDYPGIMRANLANLRLGQPCP
jgi:zinc transport system substrate-binding protein